MTTTAKVRNLNDFAADLYGKLRGRPGNLFFSPCSVNLALGMALAGARGETYSELAVVVSAGEDWRRTYTGLAAEVNGGPGDEGSGRLLTANRLLSHCGYAVRGDYQASLREVFGAEITQADFFADPDGVVAEVNSWVAGKTNGKLTNLLSRADLKADTRLILLNAIYLLAAWAEPFPRENTRQGDFTLADGSKVQVSLMSRKGRCSYYVAGGVQHLELPYQGRELSMVLSLPRKYDGLPGLEASWDRPTSEAVTARLEETEVEVFLPRFKIATPVLRLKVPLCALGAGRAFSDAADFSEIGREPLAISEVLHKAFIEVDEEKTEAAATTAVVMRSLCAMPASRLTIFRADRPFRFDIRSRKTGTILFSGRVADPRG
jgi:serpin B